MKYLSITSMTLMNLGFSLVPGNPVGWMNALVFFGCLAVLTATATFDACEFAFGGRK